MKKLIGIGVLVALMWVWKSEPAPPPESTDTEGLTTLVNRVWIDHVPTHDRDKVDVFAMIDQDPYGAFAQTSTYEGDWTAFQWSKKKGLVLRMLQSQKDYKISVVIKKGASCAPFDYCMRLKGAPRGAKQYGSMEDWVIASKDEISQDTVRELVFRQAL